jgi:putative nucleotidyltransferase with HDIG domain
MPQTAQRAFELSSDPKAEARDFIEIIESDEALSARVLKIANSVFYDRGRGSRTIDEAVLVIGTEELRNLLSVTTLKDIFPSNHVLRAGLWAHDIATAIFSREIAKRCAPSRSELAFLGGLMHDVGKLLLVQRVAEDYGKVLQTVRQLGGDFCRAESSIFPFDHTEVGQLIGERWHFNKELLDVIRNHHEPWDALGKDLDGPELPAIVKAGNLFSHAMGIGSLPDLLKFQQSRQALLPEMRKFFGFSEEEQQEIGEIGKNAFAREHELFSI